MRELLGWKEEGISEAFVVEGRRVKLDDECVQACEND